MSERAFDALCMGFTTVDQTITGVSAAQLMQQEVCPALDADFHVGGDAMNEASVLARLGMKTALATKVGGDFLARIVLSHCRREGIDTSCVVIDPDISTTLGVALIGEGDDRRIIPVAQGRSTDLYGERDIDFTVFQTTKVVSFGSMFVVPLMTTPVLERVFRAAKDAGCILCADVKMSGHEKLEDIAAVLPYVDYLFPNFGEACRLTGETEPRAVAQRFLDCGLGTIVLKLGAPGCFIKNAGGEYWIPSYLTDAVDSTGAGDNFAAGFISGLVRDLPIVECAKYASAASSICVQNVGAVGGVKSMEQVEGVIAAGEGDWARRAEALRTGWKAKEGAGLL